MHNDIERPSDSDDDSGREAVIAADDTGMISQQELRVETELENVESPVE